MRFGSITISTESGFSEEWFLPEWLFPLALEYINETSMREVYPNMVWFMEYIDLYLERIILPLEYRLMKYPSEFVMNSEEYLEYLKVREYQIIYTKNFGEVLYCNN